MLIRARENGGADLKCRLEVRRMTARGVRRHIPVYLRPRKEMNGICENGGIMWQKFLRVEGSKWLSKDFNGPKEEHGPGISELNPLKGFVNLRQSLCGCSDLPILFLLWYEFNLLCLVESQGKDNEGVLVLFGRSAFHGDSVSEKPISKSWEKKEVRNTRALRQPS